MKKLLMCSVLLSTACLETLDEYDYENSEWGEESDDSEWESDDWDNETPQKRKQDHP